MHLFRQLVQERHALVTYCSNVHLNEGGGVSNQLCNRRDNRISDLSSGKHGALFQLAWRERARESARGRERARETRETLCVFVPNNIPTARLLSTAPKQFPVRTPCMHSLLATELCTLEATQHVTSTNNLKFESQQIGMKQRRCANLFNVTFGMLHRL